MANEEIEAQRTRQSIENEIALMQQFVEPELKLAQKQKIVIDKKGGVTIEVTPTGYPEINMRDLRTGNVDEEKMAFAIDANFLSSQTSQYVAEQTNDNLQPYCKFVAGVGVKLLGLSMSKNGKLLTELRGHRVIEEGTQRVFQTNKDEQPKKRFGLF